MGLAKRPFQPRILFAVTADWYFWSHRKPLAVALQSRRCDVVVATRFNTHKSAMEEIGLRCVEVPFERSLRHPLRDLRALLRLWFVVRKRRPDVVHLVSLKPILLSALAILMMPNTPFIAAVTGMGYLFSSRAASARRVQPIVVRLLRWIFRRRNTWIIVQNSADRAALSERGIGTAERTALIPGVGVDFMQFHPAPQPNNNAPLVILPARLIWDKGIAEFVAAAAIVKRTHGDVRFVLVGALDPDNPAAIPERTLDAWVNNKDVEWWGHRSDMAAVYHQADIVCLPSYREGFPKSLLEAAASARPLVATDVPGCRDICRDGANGVLVPVRDAEQLAQAIRLLLSDESQREVYGHAGRQIAESEYAVDDIAARTLQLYAQACGDER